MSGSRAGCVLKALVMNAEGKRCVDDVRTMRGVFCRIFKQHTQVRTGRDVARKIGQI